MGDFFRLLSRGAKFDTQRISKEKAVFDGDGPEDASTHDKRLGVAAAGEYASLDLSEPEQLAFYRHKHHMHVYGEDAPAPVRTFDELLAAKHAASDALAERIVRNLRELGFNGPTAIQQQAWPVMLAKREMMACAPTGSGKTVAFIVPMLLALGAHEPESGVRGLVVCPTRELADQLHREISRVAEGTGLRVRLLTAVSQGALLQSGGRATDILITTPQRLDNLLLGASGKHGAAATDTAAGAPAEKGSSVGAAKSAKGGDSKQQAAAAPKAAKVSAVAVAAAPSSSSSSSSTKDKKLAKEKRAAKDAAADAPAPAEPSEESGEAAAKESFSLASVRMVVFDEADKLFDLGFMEQVDIILKHCTHADVQRALFTATLPEAVDRLAVSFLRRPVRVMIGSRQAATRSIHQELVYVGREDGKVLALQQLIARGLSPPVMIFVQSVERAQQLYDELAFDKLRVDVMHSRRSAAERDDIVRRFRAGDLWFLVTTDLMARGIDFKGVNTVINVDFPQSTISYIHRIGRTGRAGRDGAAYTLFTDNDAEMLRPVANVIRESGGVVPEWILQLPRLAKSRRRQLARRPIAREDFNAKPSDRVVVPVPLAVEKRMKREAARGGRGAKRPAKGAASASAGAPKRAAPAGERP